MLLIQIIIQVINNAAKSIFFYDILEEKISHPPQYFLHEICNPNRWENYNLIQIVKEQYSLISIPYIPL